MAMDNLEKTSFWHFSFFIWLSGYMYIARRKKAGSSRRILAGTYLV
jgi:hypothetical protein